MKTAVHILFTIYFIALCLVPCADKEDCNEFKQTEMSQTAHKENHADEVCTPFCSCACCATHFVVTDVEADLAVIAIINTVQTPLREAKTSAAIIPIWQPPKIA